VNERPLLEMITVYERPSDYPDKIVARVWTITPNGPVATPRVKLFDTIDDAYVYYRQRGMTPLLSGPDDEPQIVVTFI
jgi:hypothetical protein